MQFSRYIVVKAFCLNSEIWRFELQHLSSSPKEYADVISLYGNTIISFHSMRCTFSLRFKLRFARFHQVFLWKHHCFATLRKVYLFSNLRLRFRSSSLRKQCMGLSGLEPPTSRLSGVRSNRLSYKPLLLNFHQDSSFARFHQVLWGNTIISFHSMRCAIFLNSNFALLVLIKKNMWRHPPTLPYRLQYSTIGRPGLNHRVRNGNGCVPRPHRHR